MALHQSGEDYLETILMLRQKNGLVRSVDIANHLGYSKPSVSRAMSLLRQSEHILMEESGHITLTAKGEIVAHQMYQRHRLLTRFLVDLGVPEDVAAADACQMEHSISEESFQCLKRFVEGCERMHPDIV